ncbi:polysaccharide biosynthesis protein [Spirosoma luteolum]
MKPSLAARVVNRFAPRLLVLLMDLGLTGFAFLCAWLLRFNFVIDPANWHWYHPAALLLVRLLVFLWLQPFAGVIRHTGLEDVVRIGWAITLSSLLVGTLSYAGWQLLGSSRLYIPVSILAIEYFICLVLLITVRFLVRYVYRVLVASPISESRPVLIYGAGEVGIHTKDMLLRDPDRRVLGFIDDNPAKAQKTVHGFRVYTPREAAALFLQSAHKPDVVLAINQLSLQRRTEITNFLLRYQVTVKVIPSVRQWIDGELSTQQIRDVQIDDLLGRPAIELDREAVDQLVRGEVVLVTGAAGSIGSELVRQLLNHGPRELVLIDQAESALHDLVLSLPASIRAQTRLTPLLADVSDARRMRQLFARVRPGFVIHAAAYKHVPLMEAHPYEAVRVNVLGTRVVADLAVQFGVRRFVLVSTDKAVNPTNVMGATKRLAEQYVQSLNTRSRCRFIVTRFGNVLGSSGSVVPLFRQQIAAGGPVTVTHPDVIRYFMTIPEACQLVLDATVMGRGGEVFVFDMGAPVRIADLARQMIRLSGYEVDTDIALQFTGLRPGEKLYEELLSDTETTLPTHHPKIKVARLTEPEPYRLRQAYDQLQLALDYTDETQLVRILKGLLPEYISNNSPYSRFDQRPLVPVLRS